MATLHAPVAFTRVPLLLALRARTPDLAHALLSGGAKAEPSHLPGGTMTTAIEVNSLGAVRMLLDFGAGADRRGEIGDRPLQAALDMEHFRIAELLLDRGADPWALDSGGGNLGSALATPMQTISPEEAAARDRLRARLPALGWPQPAPSPRDVRALALAGHWPPPGARGAGPNPIAPQALRIMRDNAARGQARRR